MKGLFALSVLLGTPYVFPILAPDQMQVFSRYYAVFPFLLLVIFALMKDCGRIESTSEKQFWKYVTAAFLCFFLYCLLYASFFRVDPQWDELNLAMDGLTLISYIALLGAIEQRPHLAGEWNPVRASMRLSILGVLVFCFGLLTYFILLPIKLNPGVYYTWLPSVYVYLVLDMIISIRFLSLARSQLGSRWGAIYLLMGLAYGLWAVSDLLSALNHLKLATIGDGSLWDLIFFVPFGLVVLAARARRFQFYAPSTATLGVTRDPDSASDHWVPALVYAFLLSAIHLTLDSLGLLDQATRPARDRLVLLCSMLLIGVAWRQNTVLTEGRDTAQQIERETREQRNILFEYAPDGYYISDLQGNLLDVNSAAEQLVAYHREELIGSNFLKPSLLSPDQIPKAAALLAKNALGQGTGPDEFILNRKDGRQVTVEIRTFPVRIRNRALVLGLAQDIRKRKRTEEALRESEATLRSLVDNAPYGIYRSSLAGRFVSVNPAMVTMLGYNSAEEVLVLDLSRDLYADPEMRSHLIQQYQRTKRVVDVKVPWKRKGGTIITVRLSGRAVLNQRGETEGFEMIAEDVSEHQHLEEEFRQAQKMEAVGRLAGGIAHDFNNLLGVIMLGTDRLLARLAPRNPLRGKAEEIRDAANRGASLTHELLAFSRKQVLQPQILDVNTVVTDTIKMLQPIIGEDIELNMVQASDLGHVKADPAQIEQVLMNLAVNARDALPRGGRIVMETENVELDAQYASQHIGVQPGRYVMVAISDTGMGMDRTTQARMFEPFFTTKDEEKGTGLGLSTVYGIVKQSGGHIWVYSELGQGSTFKIFFPRVEEELTTPRMRVTESVPTGGSETILLVEDDVLLRRGTREVLHDSGYTVLEAGTTTQAMKIAEEHEDPIHLLLTDVVLPKRSGRFLAESLRSSRPNMKVLYVSGYTDEVTFRNGVVAQGEAFLQKPFTAADLDRKIREVLEDKSRG